MKTAALLLKSSSLRQELLLALYEKSVVLYQQLFKRGKAAWTYRKKDLKNFPTGTLGKDLYEFLHRNHFTLQEKLETHDIYHVLFDYGTTVPEEISMQYFLFASGKRSWYTYGTILLGTIILPEYMKQYIQSFQRGRSVLNTSLWKFDHLLYENTIYLKELILNKRTSLRPL